MFFGRKLASNLPIIHQSDPELVADLEPSRTRDINFQEGDGIWVCLNPIDNTWKQGVIIRQVVGVPDSFMVETNGQQYGQNKHDITFSPPKDNDGGPIGTQHAREHDGTENKTDRLRPRPVLKFPRVPTQATLHTDFYL